MMCAFTVQEGPRGATCRRSEVSPSLGREGKLELTEEARWEEPCLREF